jgi:hypothetical protein
MTDRTLASSDPPTRAEQGSNAIRSFLHALAAWRSHERFRLVPTRANTQPAFGVYRAERDAAVAHATGLMVVTLEGARIAVITSFLDPNIPRESQDLPAGEARWRPADGRIHPLDGIAAGSETQRAVLLFRPDGAGYRLACMPPAG